MNNLQTRNRVREFLPNNWGDVDTLLNQFFGPRATGYQHSHFATAGLWEDDAGYHLEIDLPGVHRDDVEITFDKGTLRIAAERKAPEGERNSLAEERVYGRVERTVRLPELVDAESIDANFAEGVLTVSVAKRPEAQPKRIEIK